MDVSGFDTTYPLIIQRTITQHDIETAMHPQADLAPPTQHHIDVWECV